MSSSATPLPVVDDPDTAGFFEAARRHELVVQLCNQCEAVLHLPRAYCSSCGSWDTRWEPVSGGGSLYSWTVVEHQVLPDKPAPHAIVLVEVDEYPGVRFVGYIPGAVRLSAGQRMRVRFDQIADGLVLPQWEPAG